MAEPWNILLLDNFGESKLPRAVENSIEQIKDSLSQRRVENRKLRLQRVHDIVDLGSTGELFGSQFKAACNRFDAAIAVVYPDKSKIRNAGNANGLWLKVGYWVGRRRAKDLVLVLCGDAKLPSNIEGTHHVSLKEDEWKNPNKITKIAQEVKRVIKLWPRDDRSQTYSPGLHVRSVNRIKEWLKGFEDWDQLEFHQIGYSSAPFPTDILLPTIGGIQLVGYISDCIYELIRVSNWLTSLDISSRILHGSLGNPKDFEFKNWLNRLTQHQAKCPNEIGFVFTKLMNGKPWFVPYLLECKIKKADVEHFKTALDTLCVDLTNLQKNSSGRAKIGQIENNIIDLQNLAEKFNNEIREILFRGTKLISQAALSQFESKLWPRDLLGRLTKYEQALAGWKSAI